jgi:hypothetical protein
MAANKIGLGAILFGMPVTGRMDQEYFLEIF